MDPEEKTKSQLETEEALEAGEQQSQEASEGFYNKSEGGGTGRKLASAALKNTPLGRAANFLSRNKKGVVTGGGILSGIVGTLVLFFSLSTPITGFLALGSMLDQFNFGTGDRNIVSQVRHIKTNMETIRGSSNTDLGARAQNIENLDRAMATGDQKVMLQKKRFNFRSMISNRAPRANWRGVLSRAENPGQRASRRIYGVDSDSRRTTNRSLGPELSSDTLNEVADSDNPRAASRVTGRQVVGNSILAGALAAGCVSSIAADQMPSEGEIYQMILELMSDTLSTHSQLADGEDVDEEQLNDLWESLHYDEEVIELADDAPDDLTQEEKDAMEERIAEIKAELEEFEDSENPPPEEVQQREADLLDEIISDPNMQRGTVTRSVTNSEAYKEMSNIELTGGELDRDMTFDGMYDRLREGPVGYMLGVGDTINTATLGLGPTACRFIMNPVVGWALTGVDVVTTVLACKASLGAGCAGRVALFSATEAMSRGVGWAILSLTYNSLTPEGPEELFGYMNMGTNMGAQERERAIGAPPISNAQANLMRDEHFALLAEEDREKGIAWRYLSPQNPRSLITNVALNARMNFNPNYLTQPFTDFSKTISSVVSQLFAPVSARNSDFHNYGIQQYGYTQAELEVDPVENAEEVEEAIRCAEGTPRDSDNCTAATTEMGETMKELLRECIQADTAKPYPEMEDMCREPTSNEREIWAKVGVWHLNNQILDSLECMSHDGPCTSASADRGGETPRELPSGTSAELAQSILNNDNIGIDAGPRGQLEDVAGGASGLLDSRILGVIVALGENNEFTITSLRRPGSCEAGSSRHRCGLAVDFSGTRGINGTTYTYDGHSEAVQSFVNDAARIIGENCEIGLPNQTYVNQTRPIAPSGCNVLIDRGSSAHVHLAVSRQ